MALRYLLDTNICIYITKKKPLSVLHKFEKLEVGQVGMSIITYGELLYGAQKSQYSKQSFETLQALTHLIPVISLPMNAAKCYGEIRAELTSTGNIIGGNDLWIASHALASHLILVTNNEKEFSRVSHLNIENWC